MGYVCKGKFKGNLWSNTFTFFQKNADVSIFVRKSFVSDMNNEFTIVICVLAIEVELLPIQVITSNSNRRRLLKTFILIIFFLQVLDLGMASLKT